MKKVFLSLLVLGFCAVPVVSAKTAVTTPTQNTCDLGNHLPKNVDMAKVRDSWLSWYNKVRKQAGLSAYSYDDALNVTATTWSDYSEEKGSIVHKRPGQKVYYDYNLIQSWFAKLGVTFPKRIGNSAFVENIGWDYYSCSKADCTADLISSIHSTYAFFMSEKNKKSRAHYDSIMSKAYKKIGLGIAVDAAKKRYYLTVHYATVVATKPGFCPASNPNHKF